MNHINMMIDKRWEDLLLSRYQAFRPRV